MTLRQIVKKIPGVTRIFGKKEPVLDKEAALDNLVHAKELLDELNVSRVSSESKILFNF